VYRPVLASADSRASGARHQEAAPCQRARRSRRRIPRSAGMTHRCCSERWTQPSTGTKRRANPLADRNPYVGPQAVGDGVFARLLAAIDNFTAVPSTFIDGGDHVVVLGRYGGTMKNGGAPLDSPFCHVYRFHGDKVVTFQQYTDTEQWTRLMK
jgi:ketosteroid isomerase-like protein